MARLILKAGQKNGQISIETMATFDSNLWGGTRNNARLLKWDNTSAWDQMAGTFGGSNAIYHIIGFDGDLFGGSGWNADAYLLVYDSIGAEWDKAADRFDGDTWAINSMIVFGGDLYIGENRLPYSTAKPRLFIYDSAGSNLDLAGTYGGAETYWAIYKMVEFGGELYGVTGEHKAMLLKWDGINALDKMAILPGNALIGDAVVFDGNIYCSTAIVAGTTYPGGELLVYNPAGAGSLDQVAPQLNVQTLAYGLTVWKDAIWAVTGPNGYVYKWDGANAWMKMADQYGAETYHWSMHVHNDRLFIGSGISGLLLEYVAGQVILVN